MNNKDYWLKREQERLSLTDDLIYDHIENMKRLMDKAIDKIENDIFKLYDKYAADSKMFYSDAMMYLADDERKEFQKDLKDYIATYKDELKSNLYKDELQALSTRARVKRLQVLQANIRIQSTELEKLLMDKMPSVYNSVYQESYFYNMFSIEGYTNQVGVRFDIPSPRIVEELLTRPWSGKDYKAKVWRVTSNFTQKLDEVLTVGLIRGEHPNVIAKNLRHSIQGRSGKGGKKFEYERLVRTEAAFIAEQATKKCYEDNKLEEYEYLATLDLRTSETCQRLDKKIFKTKDSVIGVNYPPMHPNCRSTTVPVIIWEGEEPELGERISRDSMTNRNINIDDIDYSEWKEEQYKKHGKDKVSVEEKKIRNKASDKIQHRDFKEILGKEVPSKFDDFQDMKYNNSNDWNTLKDYKKSRESNAISVFSTFEDFKKYKNIIENEIVGLTTANGIEIKSQSKHFVERVLGTTYDPDTKRPRDGIDISVIANTLKSPLKFKEEPKKNSHKFIGEKITITINPGTGNLIQCNPTEERLAKRLKNV